jgi:hypothetical protein
MTVWLKISKLKTAYSRLFIKCIPFFQFFVLLICILDVSVRLEGNSPDKRKGQGRTTQKGDVYDFTLFAFT